jgi:hypothetical protein
MTRLLTLPIVLAVVAVAIAIGITVSLINSTTRVPRPDPPVVAGQAVPNAMYEIRFDKRHDVFCVIFNGETTVFRGCKILGFTGREEEAVAATSGSGYGSYGSFRKFFDHWLVLERADGRRTYVPSSALKYLEETDEKADKVN